jgi:hypothetical protein
MTKLSRRDLKWMKVLRSEFASGAHYLKMQQSLAEFESKSTEVPNCEGLSRLGARCWLFSGRFGRMGESSRTGAGEYPPHAETAPQEFAVRLEAKSTMVDLCRGTPAFKSPSR